MPRVPDGAQGGNAANRAAQRRRQRGPRRRGFRLPCGQFSCSRKAAFTVDELNRLFAAARGELGTIAGIPAGKWWPALLLSLLDTQVAASRVVAAPLSAFDSTSRTLAVGLLVYQLHPRTAEALDSLAPYPRREHPAGQLLPWPKDGGQAMSMLFRDYRTLLHRAELPYERREMFDRLRITALAIPDVLDQIDLRCDFQPRADSPHFRRAPRASRKKANPKSPQKGIPPALPGVLTVRQFFEETYVLLKNLKADTAVSMRCAIRALEIFCGSRDCAVCQGVIKPACATCQPRQVALKELCDDLIERLMAARRRSGLSPVTANGDRGQLLAIWRYAYRKGKLRKLPREVEKLRVPKTVPTAWSAEEVGRLIDVGAKTPGVVCGIPARDYWPALINFLYDTGLRIAAALAIPSTRFDAATGWVLAAWDTQKQMADQAFRLHPDTVRLIAATKPESRDLLFPWRRRKEVTRDRSNHVRRQLKKLLRAAGLPCGKRDLFHKLRRTHATQLVDVLGEEAAMRSLGHSHISVTRRYIDPTKLTRRVEPIDVLTRPKRPEPKGEDA